MTKRRIDDHTLEVLEFSAVRETLAAYASSGLGRQAALGLYPASDPDWIGQRLGETSELKGLLERQIRIPLAGIRDICGILDHDGSQPVVFEPRQLMDIRDTVGVCGRLKTFLADLPAESHPHLRCLGDKLDCFDDLAEQIQSCIEGDESVRDDASGRLGEIRRHIGLLGSQIQQKFQALISAPEMRNAVENDKFMTRHGRAVVALKANYRQYLKGIILDRSNSGATLYVEPYALAELSNQLEDALSEEKKEIWRILWQLTRAVLQHRQAIQENVQVLSWIDLTYAKARYSLAYRMTEPRIQPDTGLVLQEARHPLLMRWVLARQDTSLTEILQQVVPQDVRLGEDYDLMLITGPNTGGKTVALKTIGLLVLMAQSGMHIPVRPDSRVPVYRRIYADIGDEQSIQQSLSTFSAHMQQIIRILGGIDNHSLVLLDELGAGTDPAEGASLATAILDELRQKGAHVAATTHLGQLKNYAYTSHRTENASMQFDLATLRPTYRLVIGTPGSSNALAIAQRLGMSSAIIRHARGLLGRRDDQVGELINQVQSLRADAEQKRQRARQILQAVRAMHLLADQRLRRTDEERRQVFSQADEQIEQVLRQVRQAAVTLLHEMQNAPKPWSERAVEFAGQIQRAAAQSPLARRQADFVETVRTGDSVYALPLAAVGVVCKIRRAKGTMILLLAGKEAEVAFGDIWPVPVGPTG
ncbi:MAG: hypothetical protein JW810_03525 [Sedimentisphaerales bacterium]|nr:hypothetical protein [Sedimentisphaerales bacterium]